MLEVGDRVVTMSYPGLFTVVAIDGDTVTITDDRQETRRVLESNVRKLTRDDSPAS